MTEVTLIDANALRKDIHTSYSDDLGILEHIDNAQTIDAQQVKHGKWEWEPGYVGTTAKCSVCGLSPMGFYSLPIIQIGRLPEYKFCPNCGAKMIGDGDD